jgi:hypothetical protein
MSVSFQRVRQLTELKEGKIDHQRTDPVPI